MPGSTRTGDGGSAWRWGSKEGKKELVKSVKSVESNRHLNVQVNIMGVMTGTEIALERMKKVNIIWNYEIL